MASSSIRSKPYSSMEIARARVRRPKPLRRADAGASHEIIRSVRWQKGKNGAVSQASNDQLSTPRLSSSPQRATRRVAIYPKGKTVFSQGEPSDAVLYIQKGSIKISVLSRTGNEAVVAMLGPGKSPDLPRRVVVIRADEASRYLLPDVPVSGNRGADAARFEPRERLR